MPELPEVQTVVSQLGRKVAGLKIEDFRTDWPKQVRVPLRTLKKQIVGATIIGTRRFGKHIVIDLGNGLSILIHLKMTGHLLVKTPANRDAKHFREDPYNQFIHHIFMLSHGTTVEFSDMRKFGWIDVVESHQVDKVASVAALGRDALSKEMDLGHFSEILARNTNKKIGALLLEQEKIAGIGNIYRSEILFRSGIRPTRRTASLTRMEKQRLFEKMKEVLKEATRLRGTSDGDFRDTGGKQGSFQKTLFVYDREGEPCKKCGTMVERKKISQRSAFFCPRCQK